MFEDSFTLVTNESVVVLTFHMHQEITCITLLSVLSECFDLIEHDASLEIAIVQVAQSLIRQEQTPLLPHA